MVEKVESMDALREDLGDYYHRGKIVGEDDRLEQPLKHQANKISWGKPAMYVQAKLDGECPRCSAKKKKGLFEMGFNEDVGCSWAYCHICGWSY